ncbi:MAG: hypothetical protein QXD43_03025 [Candidatus Aenigmatarchaeota archaeon]
MINTNKIIEEESKFKEELDEQEIFKLLLKRLTKSQIFFRKTIPFPYLWDFFYYYCYIDKNDAKKIIILWEKLGLCEIVAFRGIKIKEYYANFYNETKGDKYGY